jgi:hypothetical protein
MPGKYDVAIIGAGTAGLSARRWRHSPHRPPQAGACDRLPVRRVD